MVGGATQIKGEERSPVSRQAGSAPTSKKDGCEVTYRT